MGQRKSYAFYGLYSILESHKIPQGDPVWEYVSRIENSPLRIASPLLTGV